MNYSINHSAPGNRQNRSVAGCNKLDGWLCYVHVLLCVRVVIEKGKSKNLR